MSDAPSDQPNEPTDGSRPRLYVEVAVSRDAARWTTQGIYTYAVPSGMEDEIERGLLVIVPMQKRHVPGLILAGVDDDRRHSTTRPIHSIPRAPDRARGRSARTAEWLARESASSVYSAAALFLPPGLHTRMIDVYRLADSVSDHRAPT